MPRYYSNTVFSSADVVLKFSTSPAFLPGETLFDTVTGATGQLYGAVNAAGSHNVMVRDPVVGSAGGPSGTGSYTAFGTVYPVSPPFSGGIFTSGDVVIGLTSGASGTLSANQVANGDYTLTSPAFGPFGLKSFSVVLSSPTAGAHGAGALTVQVSNDVLQQANFPNVQPSVWCAMPEYNVIGASGTGVSVTMAAGATTTVITPWNNVSWRWYRLVWTPSDTTDVYSIQAVVNGLIDD